MSNPAKTLKKVVKAVVVVATVAAVAFIALPALSAAVGGAAAAAPAVGATAGGSVGAAAAAGGSAAAAGAATAASAASSAGVLGTLAGGAKAIGGAIAGADPLVKLGLLQTGAQFAAGAMEEEPLTEAENLQQTLDVYQSRPTVDRQYSTVGSEYAPANAGLMEQQTEYTPTAGTQSTGLLGRYNPETRKWEQA